ncbi:MAG: ATP-dependent DNA helicase RecG [Deltaproteobacteria bacterium]
MSDVLSTDIQFIKGVGPKLAQVLSKKGISTVEDALYFLPRAYEDRRKISKCRQLIPNQNATLLVKVISCREIRQGRKMRLEVVAADDTGRVAFSWFHAYPSLKEDFAEGNILVCFGEVKFFKGFPQITHPEYEKMTEFQEGKPKASIHFGRVVPVYSETEGLHQKTLRRMMGEVMKLSLNSLDDSLPDSMRERLNLPSLRSSFKAVHFPEECPQENQVSKFLQRIIFEEFFVLQLGLGLKKKNQKSEKAPVLKTDSSELKKFLQSLPFELTGDQQTALKDIQRDLERHFAMSRLVQGDVGSGKTVVALASAVIASGNGFQTALMAPTELLAQQHFRTAEKLFQPLGIVPLLLTHSNASDNEVKEAIRTGRAQLVIGTHALFQKGVQFHKLGLVIVDEQHRFGVEQRNALVQKGEGAHLLMMTATPIPRTLAFTLYGDLDLTLIRQKPANRIPIKTSIIKDRERHTLYAKLRERLQRGEQAYIIYPLIEASEKLDLKSATEMYETLRKEVFPSHSLALLHGKMKADEKEKILLDFKNKKYDILVATTVIEVGIDVPNSTLIAIEHPERLGLSQLHQLRGRVGRGSLQSECILVAESFVTERLKIMERSEDGFEIAEEDLKLRGPGEFLGTRQSGLPGFRVGHILRDAELLNLARNEALELLEKDPSLENPENKKIRDMVQSRWKEKLVRLKGG